MGNLTEQSIIEHKGFKFRPYIDSDEIQIIVKNLATRLNEIYLGKEVVFVCVLRGAFIFAADLVREIEFSHEIDFIQVSSYSGMASTSQLTLHSDVRLDVVGKHVILVEDIVDSGLTVSKLRKHFLGKGASSVAVSCFLTKPDMWNEGTEVEFFGKAIDNEFVIGYGLDFDQFGRNLPEVYIKSE